MKNDLSGKVALVTGASRGLGKAIALSLSAAGSTVALMARDAERLAAVRQEIEAAGGKAGVFVADVTKEDDVSRVASQAAAELGRVQILINNAGINLRRNLWEFSLEEWRNIIDTNLTSMFLMCRALVPPMRGSGYGRVVNLASTMSHVSLPMRSAYSSSKAAVLGLTRALALELAEEGITVNAISPGPFATEMNTPLLNDPEANAKFLTNVPMGRWGRMEEVGELACYLCSENASYVTGADFRIDGGWTVR